MKFEINNSKVKVNGREIKGWRRLLILILTYAFAIGIFVFVWLFLGSLVFGLAVLYFLLVGITLIPAMFFKIGDFIRKIFKK